MPLILFFEAFRKDAKEGGDKALVKLLKDHLLKSDELLHDVMEIAPDERKEVRASESQRQIFAKS